MTDQEFIDHMRTELERMVLTVLVSARKYPANPSAVELAKSCNLFRENLAIQRLLYSSDGSRPLGVFSKEEGEE